MLKLFEPVVVVSVVVIIDVVVAGTVVAGVVWHVTFNSSIIELTTEMAMEPRDEFKVFIESITKRK